MFQMARVNDEAANRMQPRTQFSCGAKKTNSRGGDATAAAGKDREGEEGFLMVGPL